MLSVDTQKLNNGYRVYMERIHFFFKAATKIQNKTVDFNGRFYNVFSLVRKSESHRSVKIDLPFSLILASFVISLIHIHFTLFYLRIICF